MKNLKFLYLFAFVSLVFVVTSCGDDEGSDPVNTITITIDEPMNDEIIADCDHVHIHVDFEASDENHEVEVFIHPEGAVNDTAFYWSKHDHDKVITFTQDLDLCSYGAGACFHMEVSACVDHGCEEKTTADAEFCLQ